MSTAAHGATRLFLGTMDGFGWSNNSGSFDVTVNGISAVPAPPALWLFGSGVLGLGGLVRRKRGGPGRA